MIKKSLVASRGKRFRTLAMETLETRAFLTDFYVAPDGAAGPCTASNPCPLPYVLASALQPGDAVLLQEGTYRHSYNFHADGTAEAPIVIKPVADAHVVFDLYDPARSDAGILQITGDHVVFQGFEVMSSSPRARVSQQSGSWPTDTDRGDLVIRGKQVVLRDLLIHDLDNGVEATASGGGGIFDCVIYNNGWRGPDRAHGHGIYVQNDGTPRAIVGNIIFNNYSHGIHAYGSSAAQLANVAFRDNILFGNGDRDVLIGGEMLASGIEFSRNYVFRSNLQGVVDIGYPWGPGGDDAIVTDNYLTAQLRTFKSWQQMQFTGNTLIVPAWEVVQLTDARPAAGTWDRNAYFTPAGTAFRIATSGLTFASWKSTTGFDSQSTLAAAPAGVSAFWNESRVVVFNWTDSQSVAIDPAGRLSPGQTYELRDGLGETVASGTYTGGTIPIPLQPRRFPTPLGQLPADFGSSDPRFGAFELLTQDIAANQPPALNAIPDQTMSRSQGHLDVPLVASDPDGDNLSFDASVSSYAYALDQIHDFSYSGQYWENWGGQNEKWIQDADSAWYFITPSGELYRWSGESQAAGTLVATLGTLVYADPSLLWNAQPDAPPVAAEVFGNVLRIAPGSGFTGTVVVAARVTDGEFSAEQSFLVTITSPMNRPPVFAPIADQSMYVADGVLQVPLSAADPDGDPLAFNAVAESFVYGLDREYGFAFSSDYYVNWGGRNEKWIVDSASRWYYITPDGGLYRWDGGSQATGALIATLDASVYADPSLLWNAQPGPVPVTLSVHNAVLAIDPHDGFLGTLVVLVTVSDGALVQGQTFFVRVAS
ncbi:MAG: right-handed parallel beta-helix repeat-containing protein [Pirellulaceae bacterium]